VAGDEWIAGRRLFCALLLLLVGVSAAAADIRIDESRYADRSRCGVPKARHRV
jgi:hypothetical protein